MGNAAGGEDDPEDDGGAERNISHLGWHICGCYYRSKKTLRNVRETKGKAIYKVD